MVLRDACVHSVVDDGGPKRERPCAVPYNQSVPVVLQLSDRLLQEPGTISHLHALGTF